MECRCPGSESIGLPAAGDRGGNAVAQPILAPAEWKGIGPVKLEVMGAVYPARALFRSRMGVHSHVMECLGVIGRVHGFRKRVGHAEIRLSHPTGDPDLQGIVPLEGSMESMSLMLDAFP